MAASRRDIEALYRERYLGFRRALATVTGSYEIAHEVVQEAFSRALAERRRFRGEAPLAAWVWQIAASVALAEHPPSLRMPLGETLDAELVEPARDPELSDALGALAPPQRLVFFLRYLGDLSYEEIADVCGISEGTVAAALVQARAEVSEALDEEVAT